MAINKDTGLFEPGRITSELVQLQLQAFLQIPGKNTHGFELLECVEYRHHLVTFDVELGWEQFLEFFEATVQATVAVGSIDECQSNNLIFLGQTGEIQLPEEVILERLAATVAVVEVHVVAIAADARGAGRENVLPLRVHRQVVGHGGFEIRFGGGCRHFRTALGVVEGAFRCSVAGGLAVRFVLFPLVALFVYLQHRVFLQCLLDFLLEVEGAQLQQTNRLLQLRRHGQLLTDLEL